jgi:hypothetical protein
MQNADRNFRTFGRVLLGIACGYIAYLPVLIVVEHLTYGRVDSEKAFYALYYAFGAPFLLFPSNWSLTQRDELTLNIIGGALLIVGGLLGYRSVNRALEAKS